MIFCSVARAARNSRESSRAAWPSMFCSRVSPTLMLWTVETRGAALVLAFVLAFALVLVAANPSPPSIVRLVDSRQLYRRASGEGSFRGGFLRPRYHRLVVSQTPGVVTI